MNQILSAVNEFFAHLLPIGNYLWAFPTQYSGYANIPVLGQLPLVIIMLLGAGVWFTFWTKAVQLKYFKKGMATLRDRKQAEIGVSPFASFMLSVAMRIGAGNIVGVTGAITIGGPGAVFWMWVSAFFGMATSFVEATLSQIFKERKGDEYVGGLTHYGQRIFGNLRWVGVTIGVMFIIYRMLSIPVHTFHVFTAAGAIVDTVTGTVSDRQSLVYIILAISIVALLAVVIFGGIKRVTAFTDRVVPIMAVGYFVIVIFIVIANITKFPSFISMVFVGAFKPDAIFGGAFGVAISQGIRRGLLSNEAGMGTTTMAAAVAENRHPAEQGFIQAIAVFLDTFIICSLTGFMVVMAQLWNNPDIAWDTFMLSKIDVFLGSAASLMPGTFFDHFIVCFMALCYGFFAFTTLLGGIVFCEISATRISGSPKFTNVLRTLCTFVFVPFGCLSVLAGLQLDNVWAISDLVNVIFVFINVPVILVGGKYALAALKDYVNTGGDVFVSERIGIQTDIWTEANAEEKRKGQSKWAATGKGK